MNAKEFLKKKGLADSHYQDDGMINHISELMEEYAASTLPTNKEITEAAKETFTSVSFISAFEFGATWVRDKMK